MDSKRDANISDEIQDVITAVPSWIVRFGNTIIIIILIILIFFSAIIQYPDVITTSLKVNSLNSPKIVIVKKSGKLTDLLVKDGDLVQQGQNLAFIETTANPFDVLTLYAVLQKLKNKISIGQSTTLQNLPDNLDLGELQGAYQTFFEEYSSYQATTINGYYSKRTNLLKKDLKSLIQSKQQIINQQKTQLLEYQNLEKEYQSYKKLYENKVISRSEFTQQENKWLAAKYPMQNSDRSILDNFTAYNQREKDLLEQEHVVLNQKTFFLQSLNKCLTETNSWISENVLKAPVSGTINFAGVIQQNQNLTNNQEVFIINPGNTDFFGEIRIPQYNMGKIYKDERVLVKLQSYPYEQYGVVYGKLKHIADVAFKDSVFVATVEFEYFENKDPNRKIILKNGMQAQADIVTEESTLLRRIFRNILKILHQ